MGRDKAALAFGDRSLLEWVVKRVAMICAPVLVVTRNADAYQNCGAAVITDRWPGEGPLVGLHAGLTATQTEYAVAVACDLPFVEPALLAGLIERSAGWSAVVPQAVGNIHPLCAVYHHSVGQNAEDLLRRGGGSLRRLLAEPALHVSYVGEETLRKWDPDLRSLSNLNRPEDYEAAKAALHALRSLRPSG